MAKGVWIRRNDAFQATGLNVYQLDKFLRECKRKMVGKKKLFFIDEDHLTETFKEDNLLQQQQNDDILNQLEQNVDFNAPSDFVMDGDQMQSINMDLKKARKEKILRQTKLIEQRLSQRKRQLYYDWSQRFFECFSSCFGKLKNNIVELHLNEEQVIKFNQILDTCLNNMQINLNQIWDQFHQQKEEAE